MEQYEIWKDIPGFQNIYQASNIGRIRSKTHLINGHCNKVWKQGRILKQQKSKKGYMQAALMIAPKKRYNPGVHRLVALAFISNPENKPQVNHINGCKTNNTVSNLEWVNNSENQIHAVKNNLINPNYGESHHNSKLSNKDVLIIRQKINDGESIKNLSKDYNISSSALCQIKFKRTYTNI